MQPLLCALCVGLCALCVKPWPTQQPRPLNWNFMRIALGQINTTVGDIAGNVALIARFAHTAAERGAELAVFPELSITGYPPRDLVERRGFVERAEDGVQQLAQATANLPLAIVAGYVGRS